MPSVKSKSTNSKIVNGHEHPVTSEGQQHNKALNELFIVSERLAQSNKQQKESIESLRADNERLEEELNKDHQKYSKQVRQMIINNEDLTNRNEELSENAKALKKKLNNMQFSHFDLQKEVHKKKHELDFRRKGLEAVKSENETLRNSVLTKKEKRNSDDVKPNGSTNKQQSELEEKVEKAEKLQEELFFLKKQSQTTRKKVRELEL